MKQFFGLIKELRKTPRGKGILFFAFYFILFLVLIIIISFSDNNGLQEKDYELGRPYSFNTKNIVDNNYHFQYIINKDGTKYTFEGDRYNNTELFTLNNKEYYYDGFKYYLKGTEWKEVDNPYLYFEFLNISDIESLLKIATYDSKTSYNSGVMKYNFLVSSNTINSFLYSKNTDIDEEPNSIIISTDNNDNVNEIVYHLDSYCQSEKDCKKDLEIELSYEKFGEIKAIANPID